MIWNFKFLLCLNLVVQGQVETIVGEKSKVVKEAFKTFFSMVELLLSLEYPGN